MPIINGSFSQLAIILPGDTLLSHYDGIAEQFTSRIHRNLTVNRTLTKLRDTLLPKLISGQISLSESKIKEVLR